MGMSAEQVAFFASYDERGAKLTPTDEILLARSHTPEDHKRIIRAVRLSHEFEILFYETVMAATLPEK
jgi:pyrroloquinoline-quinone synthase